MPKLSEAMESGKVIKWLKREGEPVKGGDVIAEIETDKANVEIEAFGGGVLRKIIVPDGGQVPVGQLIGVIAEPADDIGGVVAELPKTPAAAPEAPAPARALPAGETYRSAPETTAVISMGAEPSRIQMVGQAVTAAPGGDRVKASPLAKKIAAQSGVDLRLLQGTGPGGRIVRRDVETALAAAPAAPTPVT
ncbi:MAG: biotin/lipoyl-containing protein, partial [Candidatus Rokubacteria bacterium]|nr:biotin/lipoyl-containing protein [Candidatus Rokubacteria bacterium]